MAIKWKTIWFINVQSAGILRRTLFPLGPGFPVRPSGPLLPFKEVQLLMSQHSTQQLKNVFNKNPNIAVCICRNHFTFMNAIYNN